MFQLIISILAILLGIALAGIAVFYGADAFTGGKARADATTIINQATQIEAAMTLYNAQNKGQLDVGGRTGFDPSDDSNGGLFTYLTAEGNDYLKEEPNGNGGVWELKCVDSTNQLAFEGDDNPATCGSEGVALTLNGVAPEQCNLINVLLNYEYTSTATNLTGTGTALEQASEDGYVPSCTDEANAPCCDS